MDITIRNIPDGIAEAQVKEWVGVFVERFYNQKLAPPAAEVEKAKTDIDVYREANSLAAKYKATEAPKPE